MLFQFSLFSSLLLIFFVHGAVYAALCWRKAILNDSRANRWLSLFLLLCILYIGPWMLGFGGWYDNQPYRDILFYVPFQHLYWIGPVIFFYVQSLLNPSFRFSRREALHLLPGLLYLIYCGVVFITDKLVLKEYYFLASQNDPDFDAWYQATGFLSMLFYFFLSLRYYRLYRRLMVQVISYADAVRFRWVRHFLLAFLLVLIIRFGFYLADWFFPSTYQSTWWYFLFFALIFYYIAISGYSNVVETRVPFRTRLLSPGHVYLLPAGAETDDRFEEAGYAEVLELDHEEPGPEPELEAWKARLLSRVRDQKAYEDPDLSLPQLAQELGTHVSSLSRVVNRGFGVNFNDWVNGMRVEAVQKLLQAGEHRKQTLLGIAFTCGFNSKATFNRAFKKFTGQTPREWIQTKP